MAETGSNAGAVARAGMEAATATGPGAAAGTPLVALEDLRWGRAARDGGALIDGISLRVRAGERLALMGANGAGKSLTLRLMAGLIAPEVGRVTWNGAARPPRPGVALVFQRPVLLRRSVRANLSHALGIYGVPRAERAARIDALLALGRLQALADRPARRLSGGEQQRLAMVRALAARPRLLLLDEPTASLDPEATAMIEALVGTAATPDTAVVLVTHDRGQAQRLARRVVFLDRGRVVEDGPAAAFFAAPGSEAARAYLDGRLPDVPGLSPAP